MHANRNHPAFKAAAKTPLLSHHVARRRFEIMESDVAAWLCEQPEIRQEIFNLCKRSQAIVWDDGKWRGAETQSELND